MHIKFRKSKGNHLSKEKETDILPQGKNESTYFKVPSNGKYILKYSLCLRLASVILVQSYFVPDEYWQSLEIAHLNVFGYGYKTWEWSKGIRNYCYPSLIALTYLLLKILNLDTVYFLVTLPRVLQALSSSAGDYLLYIFVKRVYGNQRAFYAFILQLSSWFIFYNGSRTLTNTTEMTLVIVGIGIYNWHIFQKTNESREISGHSGLSLICGLSFCGLSCVVRPSAALIWLPVILCEVFHDFIHKRSLGLIRTGAITGLVILFVSTLVDSIFYGNLIFVHWNFFRFNVLQGMSSFYGSHSWHWYFTQGLPVVLFTNLPLVVFTVFKSEVKRNELALWCLTLLYIAGLSFVSHKEFRFLLPCIPFVHCIASKWFCDFVGQRRSEHGEDKPSPEDENQDFIIVRKKSMVVLVFLGILNLFVALYFGLVHQRGTLDVMRFLRSDLKEKTADSAVLFLMPCHSTPYYSHLHINVKMRFLECHPSTEPNYVEEADSFYQNSTAWLHSQYDRTKNPFPTHVILFNVLLKDSGVTSFLNRNSFFECIRYFHTHFPEGRVGTHVVAFCRDTL
ncbi:GPI mannosyltransferase 3-like [Rhopilema esculentum]|uniref:GPI mannosyltransferase 3-like n=1 Tax=Rhopilema esculentum TaxID=499914 RepID=UPI0031D09F22